MGGSMCNALDWRESVGVRVESSWWWWWWWWYVCLGWGGTSMTAESARTPVNHNRWACSRGSPYLVPLQLNVVICHAGTFLAAPFPLPLRREVEAAGVSAVTLLRRVPLHQRDTLSGAHCRVRPRCTLRGTVRAIGSDPVGRVRPPFRFRCGVARALLCRLGRCAPRAMRARRHRHARSGRLGIDGVSTTSIILGPSRPRIALAAVHHPQRYPIRFPHSPM